MKFFHLTVILAALLFSERTHAEVNDNYYPVIFSTDDLSTLYVVGEISSRLPLNLERALAELPDARKVMLDSPGGDIHAALAAARTIRKHQLTTEVPDEANCSSACAFLFFAGVERYAFGQLGVHQMSSNRESNVGSQFTVSDVIDVLNDFSVDSKVYVIMFRTPPDDMHYFSYDEKQKFNFLGRSEPLIDRSHSERPSQETAQASFLAMAVPDSCAFAGLRAHGPNAGLIEGFANDLNPLQGLSSAFGAQFGSNPQVVPRGIPAAQCAVLDFARAFQDTRGSGIEIALSDNSMSRSTGVLGTVHGSVGRHNWLALVDPNGQVFSLMRQLDDPIGDERRFSFRLPSAAPGIYIVIALASDSALVRAGAMQDGTMAEVILPLMTRELAVDGQWAVDIAFLELTL